MAPPPRKVQIQWVAATMNARRAQRYEDLLRQRVERLRVEIENGRVANHEVAIGHVLHDVMLRRRSIEDLPLDVLLDVKALVDKRIQLATDRLTYLAAGQEGAPAALVPQPLEAAQEPPTVPQAVVAPPMEEGAPPLGMPMDAPMDAGEPRQ